MDGLPTGTITFLFTDVEASTRLWQEQPEWMRTAMARHDEILRSEIEGASGHVVKTTGDGVLAAFSRAQLTVHHPRGWMGVAAGFDYDIDPQEYPTFQERAECARRLALEEFPADELISVFLLGSGDTFAE